MNQRKLILYIACSLDGFIAGSNDDLSFLDRVHKEGEDYGYNDFISSVDTVILGRKTYDWVVDQVKVFPHQDKETFVITHKALKNEGNITFYNGDVKELLAQLKSTKGKNIFCDGGAEIVNALFKEKLFDELIISIIPVLLGEGIRLFQNGIPKQALTLVTSKKYDTGLVQVHYKVN